MRESSSLPQLTFMRRIVPPFLGKLQRIYAAVVGDGLVDLLRPRDVICSWPDDPEIRYNLRPVDASVQPSFGKDNVVIAHNDVSAFRKRSKFFSCSHTDILWIFNEPDIGLNSKVIKRPIRRSIVTYDDFTRVSPNVSHLFDALGHSPSVVVQEQDTHVDGLVLVVLLAV